MPRHPLPLNVLLPTGTADVELLCLEVEADEIWSFVREKKNKHWVWLACSRETRQIIAFYVGERSRHSAHKLWLRIPSVYRRPGDFLDCRLEGLSRRHTRRTASCLREEIRSHEWRRALQLHVARVAAHGLSERPFRFQRNSPTTVERLSR